MIYYCLHRLNEIDRGDTIMNQPPFDEYRPMSAWGYFGYEILFSIPLLGFILLIVFSFDNSYIARRNFARSFFCALALALIIVVILYSTGLIGWLISL